MQYKEFTQTHSKDLIEQISSIMETHMIGRTVIVKGKKGKVIKQVGSDGKTESDEIYQVKFEDGTVADIPARDMEMQGDDNKKIGENEAEELVKEAKESLLLKQINAHPRIPGMSNAGKRILAHMTNSFKTGGGPHIHDKNIHNLTTHSVNQTIEMASKHLEDNPHPEASRQLALIKKELDESVVKEANQVRVKTQSGTTERVSPDDLKAAGDVFDRIKLLKLAIADAAHQKKADNK